MANENSKILTADQEAKLRQPIDDYVGKIQKEIDGLRADGTEKVVALQNKMDGLKRDRSISKSEKESEIAKCKTELEKAKAVEAKNKDQISKLIADAEGYLNAHFDKEYYQPVLASCQVEKVAAKERYQKRLKELEAEHKDILSKLTDHQEIKDENYVYKTEFLMQRLSWKKTFSRLKTADMLHTIINSI